MQQENFCLTSSIAVTVLLLFACEYCQQPHSLPTNEILIKLSFWSVHVKYWEIKQNNDILQFL